MASGLVTGAWEAGRQIGRHFALAAALPSVVLTGFTAFAFASGAPAAEPSWARLGDALSNVGFGESVAFLGAVLAVGLILHPLVYVLTQALEGYWGTSKSAEVAMTRSARNFAQRALDLEEQIDSASWSIWDSDSRLKEVRREYADLESRGELTSDDYTRIRLQIREDVLTSLRERFRGQEASRLRGRLPEHPEDCMPTRLGNALRRYERLAGQPYGLEAITAVPLLAQVADGTLRDYHDDARTDLDLGVQMVITWACATAVGFAMFWPYGYWMLVPLGTTLLSLLSYRGAVAAAEDYGIALMTLTALGRPALYRSLGIDLPSSLANERARAATIDAMIRGERDVDLRLRQAAGAPRRADVVASEFTPRMKSDPGS